MWSSTAWVEAGYSLLSWTAKLYVFWTAFAFRYKVDHQTLNLISGLIGVVVLVSIGWFVEQGRHTLDKKNKQLLLGMPH